MLDGMPDRIGGSFAMTTVSYFLLLKILEPKQLLFCNFEKFLTQERLYQKEYKISTRQLLGLIQ